MARLMKDSGIPWIGEIPVDWRLARIKHLCNEERDAFQDGDWIESPYITDNGIRYLTTGNVGDGVFKRQGNGFISEETFKELNCKYAYPNDLVISRLNAPYGRACILPGDEEKYVLAVDIVILRTDNEKRFLCYLMQCEGYQKIVQDGAKGTTMQRISRTNLGNIVLPIAPDYEQQRIANFLDAECARIDAIIEQTRATVEEYKKLKQSIITQAVTKGIRRNRPMKDSGIEWIGEIPEDWEVQRFKNVTKINGRIGFRGYTTDDLVSEGEGAITLSPSNIVDLKIIYEKCSYISWEKYNESPEIQIQNGDVIFVKTGSSYGKSGIVNDLPLQATINPQLVVFKEISTDHRYFLYFLQTQSVRNEIEGIVSGGTIPTMAQEKMKNFHICVPPEREQKEIADHIDLRVAAINDIIEKKLSFIVELGSYKKSLIYEYVTGKKEAPL